MIQMIKRMLHSVAIRILGLTIILILPLNIWGIFSVAKMQKYMFDAVRNSIYSIGQLMMSNLDSRMSSVDDYLFNTLYATSDHINVALKGRGDDGYYHAVYNLHYAFADRLASTGDAGAYFYYDIDNDYLDIAVSRDSDTDWQKFSKWLEGISGYDAWGTSWLLVQDYDSHWLVRIRNKNSIYYGAVIDFDAVAEEHLGSVMYMTLEVGWKEKSSGKSRQSVSLEKSIAEDLDDRRAVSTACFSDKLKYYLVLSVKKSEILQSLPVLQRGGIVLSILLFGVMPVLLLVIHRWILKPIRILQNALEKVSAGEKEYQINEIANSSEFEALYNRFNQMIVAENEMNAKLIEKELYGKKMELQTLQLQIRPHFLLNSFNLLYGLVTMGKIESSQQMILYLSDYFRYIFRSGKEMVHYEEELGMIKQYVEIAKMRYPFTAFEEVHDEEILMVKVPPMLLHNFVENIFKHGLRTEGITKIRLEARYFPGMAEFKIIDDGRGMDSEMKEWLNQGKVEVENQGIHVGFTNANRRIKFFYGEDAGFHIESEVGKGTTVIVALPCEPDEEVQ